MNHRIIGIDPANLKSGIAILENNKIIGAYHLENQIKFYDKVTNFSLHSNLIIVIEDIKPYSVKLMQTVIDTCKFIGEAVYRLRTIAGLNVVMVDRFTIKKWCYDTFPSVCLPIIDDKIEKKLYDACIVETREAVRLMSNGRNKRKPSFVYIDDKSVTECMKKVYGIPNPPKGKGYLHGLNPHSFQALAVATYYHYNKNKIATN